MGTTGPTPSVDSDILISADKAFVGGRLAEAKTAYARAFEDAARHNDPVRMARAMLGFGGLWVNESRGPDEYALYREQIRQTLHALPDGETELRGRLNVRLAAEQCYAEGAPVADARTAVEAVRRAGNASSLCEALSLFHHLLLAPHDQVERDSVAYELGLAAARDGSPITGLVALVWNTVDAFLISDTEAPRLLARLRRRAEELDHAAITFLARMIDMMQWLRSGRIADVEATLDEVHAYGVEAGEVDATPWMAGQLLAVRWLQGRQHEVLDGARVLADSPDLTRFNRVYPAVWAAFAASAGEYDEARVALARVDSFGAAPYGLAPSSSWLVTMFAVVEAIRHLDDPELASQAYTALEPFAELPIIGSLAIVCFGSMHRSLAWCATVSGEVERAIEHFRRAIDHDIRIGNLPMLAVTRAELAQAITQSDRATALTLYQQAIDSGTKFGMDRWVEFWQDQYDIIRDQRTVSSDQARWWQQGKVWEIEVGATHFTVTHSIGMGMIRMLLASPYTDISVEALTGAPLTTTRQNVLDARARDELRRRVNEIQQRMDQADRDADAALSEQLGLELDTIKSELVRTLGLRGTSRDFSTPTERARTSVQKAIRRALGQIAEQAPDLADQLTRSIHTGTFCRYQPVAELPQTWTTSA